MSAVSSTQGISDLIDQEGDQGTPLASAEREQNELLSDSVLVDIPLDQNGIEIAVKQHSKEIPCHMRYVLPRDLYWGFLGSTSFVTRVLAGISLMTLSSAEELNTASYYTKLSARWGYWLGFSSIITGIGDIFTFGGFSNESFISLVNESIKYHKDKSADFNIDKTNKFLDFAVGEYIDIYQRRGAFNKIKFKNLLLQYQGFKK